MEGCAFAIELFVIIFSFSIWLITPEKSEVSQLQETANLKETTKLFEVPELPKEVLETPNISRVNNKTSEEDEVAKKLQSPLGENFELKELQQKLGTVIQENIKELSHKEVRAVAKILRISQYVNRRNLTKANLAEKIIDYLQNVQLQQDLLTKIQEVVQTRVEIN